MVFQYDRLWPGHPFRFRIPFQETRTEDSARREYIATPKPIKATVLKLLADLEDEEWIFWCLDDKYPVQFDLPKVEALTCFVRNGPPAGIDAVLFCRCHDVLDPENLTGGQFRTPEGEILLRRKNYHQIWIHQFLRVKVIRHLFEQFPDEIPYAKYMDDLKDRLLPPDSHGLYVTEENRAIYGESTVSGGVTLSCLRSMAAHGALPPQSMGLARVEVALGELRGSAPAIGPLTAEAELRELSWRLAATEAELATAQKSIADAAEKSATLKEKLKASREERDALRASAEYRLGRKVVNPLRKLARAVTGKGKKQTEEQKQP
jgi:hypothetical protein